MTRLQRAILIVAAIPLGCMAFRSIAPKGVLFAVRNETATPIALHCDGVRIDTAVIDPQRDILIRPRDLAKCMFSEAGESWRYPFDSASADLSSLRQYGFQRDSLDPYLCIFEIRSDRGLHTRGGSASLPGFPIPADFVAPRDAKPPVSP